jgi:hypothetical protein
VRNGYVEQGLVTSGNDLNTLRQFAPATGWDYRAADVIDKLMDGAMDHVGVSGQECFG